MVPDGIELLGTATYSFESFSLENISRELQERGKLLQSVASRAVEIEDMRRTDQDDLARYNLGVCALVLDIFKHAGFIDLAIGRSCLTGLEMGRQLTPIDGAILGLKGNLLSLHMDKQTGLFDYLVDFVLGESCAEA